MAERNLNEGLKQEVNKLKTQVQRLNNIVWVVGIVAVIFGISGGWGYNTLSKAQNKLENFENEVEKHVENFKNKADAHFNGMKKDLEKIINDKENYFDANYVKYDDKITLRSWKHKDAENKDYLALSGSYGAGVRTKTSDIGNDELWKIVRPPKN